MNSALPPERNVVRSMSAIANPRCCAARTLRATAYNPINKSSDPYVGFRAANAMRQPSTRPRAHLIKCINPRARTCSGHPRLMSPLAAQPSNRVPGCRRDFLDPCKQDAGSLLDRKRIIRRFENDTRAQASRSDMQMTPDFAGLRIALKPGREPTKPRWLILDHRRLPQIENASEALFGDRDPDGPNERLMPIQYQDFQAAPHVVLDAVNRT